jgi:uncharacterized protein
METRRICFATVAAGGRGTVTASRALIVFAKLPRVGDVKTRLGKEIGMEEAGRVYEEFARHAFTIASTLSHEHVAVYLLYAPGADEAAIRRWVGHGFRYFPQEGASLGDRMHAAFRKVFNDGATEAVIIGTDVPELDVETVRAGFEKLQSCDVVIGPSSDGGYYLLGIKERPYDVFSGISWSTTSVLQETRLLVARQGLTTVLLPEMSDIDTFEDYRSYLRKTGRGGV